MKNYIIVGVIGLGAGMLAGWFGHKLYIDHLAKQLDENEEEFEEVDEDEYYNALDTYNGVVINPTVDDDEETPVKPSKITVKEEVQHPVDSNEDDNTGEDSPYLITIEQYEDETRNWDKAEYTYFAKPTELRPQGCVVDEIAGMEVLDVKNDTGFTLAQLKQFFDEHGEILCVRNPELACDIMVRKSMEDVYLEEYEGVPIDHEGGEK